KDFSCLVTNQTPDKGLIAAGQGYFLYDNSESELLFDNKYNINSDLAYKSGMDEESLFKYIYAVMHSTEYREKFQNNLVKDVPRIPLLKNKDRFIEIGDRLINLHLNYEAVEQYSGLHLNLKTEKPS